MDRKRDMDVWKEESYVSNSFLLQDYYYEKLFPTLFKRKNEGTLSG